MPACVVCSNPSCAAGDSGSDVRDHLVEFFISAKEIARLSDLTTVSHNYYVTALSIEAASYSN